MRAVIQRVSEASVTIDGTVRAQIGKGYLLLLGCENADDSTSEQVVTRLPFRSMSNSAASSLLT